MSGLPNTSLRACTVLTVHASHACPCCSLFCSLPVFAVFVMIKLKLCCNVCNQVAKFYILYIGIPFLNILLWPVDILPSLIWLYDYSLYPLCFFPLNCLGCLSKQETAKFTKCHLRTACIESRRVRWRNALLLIYSSLFFSHITPVAAVTEWKRLFIVIDACVIAQ